MEVLKNSILDMMDICKESIWQFAPLSGITGEKDCEKDKIQNWACHMKLIISQYANKRFCDNPSDRRKCCKTCRAIVAGQHDRTLPLEPKK